MALKDVGRLTEIAWSLSSAASTDRVHSSLGEYDPEDSSAEAPLRKVDDRRAALTYDRLVTKEFVEDSDHGYSPSADGESSSNDEAWANEPKHRRKQKAAVKRLLINQMKRRELEFKELREKLERLDALLKAMAVSI